MGSQVIAICQCGLRREILIGGGMLNFKYINFFPCLCENCNDVVQVNLKNQELTCPNCNKQNLSPYNAKHLIGEQGNSEVSKWGDNTLTNGTYKCPKCKEMTLHFERGILWD